MRITEAAAVVAELASQQWGLFTSAQARAVDINSVTLARLADRGLTVRMRHGVYASASTPITPTLEIKAHWLALEPQQFAAARLRKASEDAIVSHVTAAQLHHIGDLVDPQITFTTANRRQSRQSDVRFVISSLDEAEVTIMDGLPITTVGRTIYDLTVAGHERGHLDDMLKDTVAQALASKEELAHTLAPVAEYFGTARNTAAAMRSYLNEIIPEPTVIDVQIDQALERLVRRVDEYVDGRGTRGQPQEPAS